MPPRSPLLVQLDALGLGSGLARGLSDRLAPYLPEGAWVTSVETRVDHRCREPWMVVEYEVESDAYDVVSDDVYNGIGGSYPGRYSRPRVRRTIEVKLETGEGVSTPWTNPVPGSVEVALAAEVKAPEPLDVYEMLARRRERAGRRAA